MSVDGFATGFFSRGRPVMCFQVSRKVTDEMEAFRIGMSDALMGWSPLVNSWWGQGYEEAPE